jgi:hypothetical protein
MQEHWCTGRERGLTLPSSGRAYGTPLKSHVRYRVEKNMHITIETSRVTSLLVLALASLCQLAVAKGVLEACDANVRRLATVYEMSGYPDSFHSNASQSSDPVKAAEQVVQTALGQTRSSLEKKWPGFFDWSTTEVLKALRDKKSTKNFRLDATVDCSTRFN